MGFNNNTIPVTGATSTFRADRARLGPLPAYGKPGITMASSSLLVPHGIMWFGRRGLNNPYGFWLSWLFVPLFLLVVKTLA